MPNEGGVRHGEPVIDPIAPDTRDTFFTHGPSDPLKWAGKNGVGTGPVPLTHERAGANFQEVAPNIGQSRPGTALRPESRKTQAKK